MLRRQAQRLDQGCLLAPFPHVIGDDHLPDGDPEATEQFEPDHTDLPVHRRTGSADVTPESQRRQQGHISDPGGVRSGNRHANRVSLDLQPIYEPDRISGDVMRVPDPEEHGQGRRRPTGVSSDPANANFASDLVDAGDVLVAVEPQLESQ